jgi:hypothetical protein
LVYVGAAAPDGCCASRRRPRDPWWTTSWGEAIASMAWVKSLCHPCDEVVGSVNLPQSRWPNF